MIILNVVTSHDFYLMCPASTLWMEDEDPNEFFDMLSAHGGDSRYYTIDSFNDRFSYDANQKLSIISFNI